MYYWVDLVLSGKIVRLGFHERRSHIHFGWSLILPFVVWTLFTVVGVVGIKKPTKIN